MDTLYQKDYIRMYGEGNKLVPKTRFGDTGDCFNLNKEKKRHINANKMNMNTTNKELFKDFKIMPNHELSRRSNSVAQIKDNRTIVTVEKVKRDPNDSNEFRGTLSFSSPFFNKSSYQNNFQDLGFGEFFNKFLFFIRCKLP